MTTSDVFEILSWIQKAFFPKWPIPSDEQLGQWQKRLAQFPVHVVREAMPVHWEERGNFTTPELKGLVAICYEIWKREAPRRTTTQSPREKEKVIDWLKRESEDRPAFGDMADDEIVMFHCETAWSRVKFHAAPEVGRQFVRGLIFSHCLNAMLEIGKSQQQARKCAEKCTGLKPGERIEVRELFEGVTKEKTRSKQEQLEALARFNHEQEEAQRQQQGKEAMVAKAAV